jgi:hypothetical protein
MAKRPPAIRRRDERYIFLLPFFEKCILIIDISTLSLDKEAHMNIRQAILGAGVAALLVLGADGAPVGPQAATALQASSSTFACDSHGVSAVVRQAAHEARDAVLDVVFDAAGEIVACAKEVF